MIYFVLLISLSSTAIYAQDIGLEWAKSIGGTSNDVGTSITTDASGNVYVTGRYFGMADFDPSSNSFILTSNGAKDVFIQKLDAGGNFIWAKSTGGIEDDFSNSITTDAAGNIYVTGYYQGTVDFDPSANSFNLISNGARETFIQKLDAGGNFILAKSMGGVSIDVGNSITTDAAGNVYVTGYYYDVADFDPSTNTFNLTSNGWSDIFILKLDSAGNFIWAKSMGGTLVDIGNSVTTDASGNVYLTGRFNGTADFDPGANTFNLTPNGGYDVLILKLDSSGNFVWAKSIGGSLHDIGKSIITYVSENVYVTGTFRNTVDFDPSANTFNITADDSGNVFILKLDTGANFIWAKSIGGIDNDIGQSITTDMSGNVFVTGCFEDVADFDPSTAIFNLTSKGKCDVFITKLDAGGNFIWAKSMGGASNDVGESITTNDIDNVYTTGNYQNTADFDPSKNSFNLTSNGSGDFFIQKLSSKVGIKASAFFNSVSVFPNPNSGTINIDLGNLKEVSIKVFSVGGQLIYRKENITSATFQFELNAAAGVYFIELNAQGETQQYKVVKK